MKKAEILQILKTELVCIRRNDGKNCNRKCDKCDLVMDSKKLIQAYEILIKTIENADMV